MSSRFKSSPCIGFCSTTYGDDICRGCYRSLHQVLHWVHLSDKEKQDFYDNIAALADRELSAAIDIVDIKKLNDWRNSLQVYCPDLAKRSISYDLLQALQQGINIMTESDNACRLTRKISLPQLYRQVDSNIYKTLMQQAGHISSTQESEEG